jgi:hypothetical protein
MIEQVKAIIDGNARLRAIMVERGMLTRAEMSVPGVGS